jgi:hypothetical protein
MPGGTTSGVVSAGASVGLAVPGGAVRVVRLGRSICASYFPQ